MDTKCVEMSHENYKTEVMGLKQTTDPTFEIDTFREQPIINAVIIQPPLDFIVPYEDVTKATLNTPKTEIHLDINNHMNDVEISTTDPEPLYSSERTTCKFCCITFANFDELTNHLLTHAPPKYECVICDKTFDSKPLLQAHFVSHNMEQVMNVNVLVENIVKGVKCYLCTKYFENLETFYNHLPNHTLQMTYCCHVCSRSFSKCELLNEHFKEHNEDVSLRYHTKAPITKLDVVQLNLLTSVLKNLDIRNIFYCNLCSLLVLERMDIHMKQSHSEFQTNIYRCHVCGKYFESNENLRKHFETFIEKKNLPEKIKSNHSSNSQLKKALRANGIPASCIFKSTYENNISDSSSQESDSLNFGIDDSSVSFVTDHTLDEMRLPCFTCPVCNDTPSFNNEKKYRKHLKSHKCNCDEPECAICSNMLKPINYCSICDKLFANERTLQNHQKTHEAERRRDVICEICGKGFFNKNGLRNHMPIHDTAICRCGVCQSCVEKNPKYQCEVCKKIFISESKLKRHSFVHSGEKPYVCEVCGKGFSQHGNLKVHVRSHERIRASKNNSVENFEENVDSSSMNYYQEL